jgi:serine/threonine protein phosphatase PrpC
MTADHPSNGRATAPDRMVRSEVVALPHGTAIVFCDRCPLKDTPNEDAAIIVPVDRTRSILAVADGMGGRPGGHEASEIALDALRRSIRTGSDGRRKKTDLRVATLNGFDAANERVGREGGGGGTTLAVVEIDGTTVRPYHVGDSVILVLGQRGRLRLQTVAHSPVGYAIESGLLDESDAMHHQDRHLVSNFVGSPDMRIEIGPPIALHPRDTLVLGSDGLFDNLHVQEVVETVRKGTLETAAETLVAACRRRMLDPQPGHPSKADDLTFILYRPRPAARPPRRDA